MGGGRLGEELEVEGGGLEVGLGTAVVLKELGEENILNFLVTVEDHGPSAPFVWYFIW